MPLSCTLTVGHAHGPRAIDADAKRGMAVTRKVAALTTCIPRIPPVGTVTTIVHPALPVAAQMMALFTTANTGTVASTVHHRAPVVFPRTNSDASHGCHH